MSDGSRSSPGERRGRREEKDLDSETLALHNKRFYVDVKENERGRFIKLAEVSLDGRRNRLIMPMSVATMFRDHLGKFIKFYDNLAAKTGENHNFEENSLLMSENIVRNSRKYSMSLKENRRGHYLRVTQTFLRSMYPNVRLQIALPASGMAPFRDILTRLLEKYSDGYISETEDDIELPESKSIRSENKVFYFDVNHNHRGTFVRVKHLTGRRSSIAIPQSAWASFSSTFKNLLKSMEKPKEAAVANGTMKERGD
uniref:Transcriptional activator protein Pur-alpha n=1 Tax=Syphacia muris TaxID=451379 RepID=A0A0N5AVD8_9BILA